MNNISYKLKYAQYIFSGEKRRFGLAGLANVLLTNVVLQLLLSSNLVSIVVCTFISQAVNTLLGYAIYGKLVFRKSGISRNKTFLVKYFLLMLSLWWCNTFGISIGSSLGYPTNLVALLLIPILAIFSYIIQKYWVFEK